MKERSIKRVMCLLLATMLVVTLCACGSAGTAASNNQASKLYVYSSEDIDLGIDSNNVSVRSLEYVNNRIYVLLQDYSGQYGAAAGARMAVTEAAVVMPEVTPEDTVTGEGVVTEPEEVVYTGPVYVLISANIDGSDRKEVILERNIENAESMWMNNVLIGSDGSVIATQEEYKEDTTDPNNPVYMSYNYLIKWDADGKFHWKKDIKDYVGDVEYFYPRNIFTMNDGSIVFISYEGLGAVIAPDGNMIAPIELDSEMTSTMANIFQKSDGTTYMTSYNQEYTKMFISTIDLKTSVIGKKQELPGNIMNFSFHTGYNTDFILTNNIGVYTYNLGDESPVQIMDFINSDFPSTYLNGIVVLDDTHMLGYYNDQTDGQMHFAYFTKVNPEDVPDKTTLVLGCNYIDYNIRKRIVDFNKTNPKYRITIKDYSIYATMDDYQAGYTQLNNDIISNQMPDILVVNTDMDTGSYISKGAFADIGELIAKDEELSQTEFLPNIMDAFSVDGKLYTLVPSFSIRTMIGKTSILGEKTGWNMADMIALSESLPEGSSIFGPDMLRDNFMYQVLSFLGDDFVDPVTGTCSFESEEFIHLLEYAKTLPAEHPKEYWEDYDYTLYESMYRENKAILMECYVSTIQELKYQIKGRMGEEVTFIGFPAAEGNGSVINPNYTSFALSARSKNLDGSWEFIRYYLTDEFQSSNELYEFPVSKEAFLKKAAEATQRPYWTDENGNKVEYDETYYINGEEIILEPFTQKEVDEICEFIYSVTKVSRFDNDIRTIIMEDADGFFEGKKSAQEVAKIIQSRAQVFVDENR